MKASLAVRVASERAHLLAESPRWDPDGRRLLWVDIRAGTVFEGRLRNGVEVDRVHRFRGPVGAVVPAPGGELLVAEQYAVTRVGIDGARTRIAQVLADGTDRRLNDGACDPAGRFLVGSLHLASDSAAEVLVRIDGLDTVTIIDDDLALSNGLGWSRDGKIMYSVDTALGTVWQRRYDPVTGSVGQRTCLIKIADGSPDGMCVDAEDQLWIAIWGAGEVRRYAPTGEQTGSIELPVPFVSSVAFVGPELDTLLITTAQAGDGEGEGDDDMVGAGRLFLATPEVGGLPDPLWRPV